VAEKIFDKFLTDRVRRSLSLCSGGNSGVVGQVGRRPRLHFGACADRKALPPSIRRILAKLHRELLLCDKNGKTLLMRKVRKPGGVIGVYAGSFDPLTVGHVWMIAEGAKLFPSFIVAIGRNPDKRYTFTDAERLTMLTEAAKAHRHVRVDSFENEYLIDYARSVGATHILRGIRSSADFEYERFMRNINGDLAPGLTTVFLLPPREIAEVSSSMVKGLIGPRGWEKIVRPYVPPPVYRQLLEQYHERRLAK